MLPIRVFIADDHALLRNGLRRIIDAQPDMTVVGEAGDVASAVERAALTGPDVILLDLAMPGGGGLTAIGPLRDACPGVRVLMVTMFDDRAHLRLAVEAGASGYVIKSAPHTELVAAIRTVHAGRTHLSDCLDDPAVPFPPSADRRSQPAVPARPLSPREREVLTLVARGHTSREIAAAVGLSIKTVEAYRARVMHKLGLESRAELVSYALEAGFVTWPPGTTRD